MTFDPLLPPHPITNKNVLTNYGPNWVVSILPYIEETALRDSFDKGVFATPGTTAFHPINDNPSIAANVTARGTVIPVLLCPSDSAANTQLYQGTKMNHGGNWARANYAAMQAAALSTMTPVLFIWAARPTQITIRPGSTIASAA